MHLNHLGYIEFTKLQYVIILSLFEYDSTNVNFVT